MKTILEARATSEIGSSCLRILIVFALPITRSTWIPLPSLTISSGSS